MNGNGAEGIGFADQISRTVTDEQSGLGRGVTRIPDAALAPGIVIAPYGECPFGPPSKDRSKRTQLLGFAPEFVKPGIACDRGGICSVQAPQRCDHGVAEPVHREFAPQALFLVGGCLHPHIVVFGLDEVPRLLARDP